MKPIFLALCLFACVAQADTVMSPAPPADRGWQAKSGTSNVDTPVQTEAACWALAHAKAERDKKSGNFTCINTKAARIDYKAPVVVPPVVTPPVPGDPHNGGVQPGNQPRYNPASIPAPALGSSTYDVVQNGQFPGPSDIGAFRTRCTRSHFNRDDSLVFPGQVGRAHLHVYWGNTKSDANTTADAAQGTGIRSNGNSTCRGGIANRSTYWAPPPIDTATGNVIDMEFVDVYYKTGYQGVKNAAVQSIPPGLRIIAGDMTNSKEPGEIGVYSFRCTGASDAYATIPHGCTGQLEVSISFPQCWDGRNLSAPDNKSHMAYASVRTNGCPTSHPVPLPEIAYIMHFPVPPGSNTTTWRLSSDNYVGGRGGNSMHADWINGWDPALPPVWTSLIINKGLSGGSHMIGDGRSMN